MSNDKILLSEDQQSALFEILEERFEKNPNRHQKISWNEVRGKLIENQHKLWAIEKMESTGGEPDVIGVDSITGEFVFADCAKESPTGRRSLCYDQAALDARKENKPRDSAMNMAREMGIEVMTELEYRELQQLGEFDLKTSSWIKSPDSMRTLGGALFGDRRYDRVFAYHNGAESYYAARGFRGILKV